MDYSKVDSQAIEGIAGAGRRDEARLKAAGFEHRIDRLNEDIKRAKTEGEAQKYRNLKDQSIKIYKKYRITG